MTKKLTCIFAFAFILLASIFGFLFTSNHSVSAETKKTEFTDDFTLGGSLSNYHFDEYDHVTKDTGAGNKDYALIPASTWGAYVDSGDGYIIYKFNPGAGKALANFKITISAYYGYARVGIYAGNTDIRIYVSNNKTDFGSPVFKASATTATENFTVVDSDGNPFYGMNGKNTDPVTISGDLSSYSYSDCDNYIKIEFDHMSYDELNTYALAQKQPDGITPKYPNGLIDWFGAGCDPTNQKISLDRLGIRVKSIGFSYEVAKPTKKITLTKDFTKGSATKDSFFESNHVYRDYGSGNNFGLIPSTSWGSYVPLDDGYFTYKLTPESNYVFDSMDISMNVFFDHKCLAANIGAENANVRIYTSTDNVNFTKVFDLVGYSSYSDFTVVNKTTGDPFTGMDTNNQPWTPLAYTITGDISSTISTEGDTYVKVELINLNYTELSAWTQKTYSKTPEEYYIGKDDIESISLQYAPVGVQDIAITGYEVKSKSSTGSTFIDFNDYTVGSKDWIQEAFGTSGLKILGPVGYYDRDGKAYNSNVLGPNSANTEGYVIYKYEAPSGFAFGTGNVEVLARLFDNNLSFTNEKVDFYISYDNSDYQLVHKCTITKNYKSVYDLFDIDEYVYSRSLFYLKMVIGSNWSDWTNVGTLKVDLSYQEVGLSIDFDGITQSFKTTKGKVFDTSSIIVPSNFTREDNKYYTSDKYDEEFDIANTPILSDTTLFVKGVWDKYQISYVLNGGVNNQSNPSEYISADGAKLFEPTKTGNVFAGWFIDAEFTKYYGEIPVGKTGDITLYAKWVNGDSPIKLHAITYELNGGVNDASNPTYYIEGVGVSELKNATKSGETFEGWYDNAEFSGSKITSISTTKNVDIKLYAKYQTGAKNYTINYVLGDGGVNNPNNPTKYEVGVGVASFGDPTKDKADFIGWYGNAEFSGNKITSISAEQTGDITLYAKWKSYSYITYELNGGTNYPDNPTKIYEKEMYKIGNPTKTGYKFNGWYDEFGNIVTEVIGQGKDIKLTAKWTQEKKGGCGSTFNITGSIVLSSILTLAAVIFVVLRNKRKEV